MLNPTEVAKMRTEFRDKGDVGNGGRYLLKAREVRLGDTSVVIAEEPGEVLDFTGPARIFGTPADERCLQGVPTRSVVTPPLRMSAVSGGSVLGWAAIMDEDGCLYAPGPIDDPGALEKYKPKNDKNYDGFALESAGDKLLAIYCGRPDPIRHSGTALFIPFIEQGNYGSFLIRALPKLLFVKEFLPAFDYYVVPERTPWLLEAFSLLKLPEKPVLSIREVSGDQFHRLLFVTDPEVEGFQSKSMRRRLVAFADEVAEPPADRSELLFLSRALNSVARPWYRPLRNEIEVERVAGRAGFHPFWPETLSLRAQVSLLHRAKGVMGPSGSGMLNAVFVEGGARLVDLESFHWTVRQHAKVYASSGIEYAFLFGAIEDGQESIHLRPWSVDTKVLGDVLAWCKRSQ